MIGIVIEPTKSVYWYIPKNMCTVMKRHIATLTGIPVPPSGNIHDAMFRYTGDPIPGYRNIAIIRHPFRRILSLWVNKIADGHPIAFGYQDGMDINVFYDVFSKISTGMPFRDFVKVILDPSIPHNHHWAPQCGQVPINCYLYRMEDCIPLFQSIFIQENASHATYRWSEQADADTIDLCKRYYKEDFDRFGYQYDLD